ncbi:glycosyltransferase [Clostridium akagii]|uniref:glycosyltransferase n=1 Tax=Clostridium akagii TaxID=91623 RepID=UPI00047EFCA7|nr:glycosyltransferase [Clostridium akagii]
MKILHLCTGYPLSFQGGITNYVRMLAEKQSINNQVSVVGGGDNKKDHYPFEYYEYETKVKLPYLGKAKDKKALKKLKEYIKVKKFDLIHIHMMLDIDWEIVDVLSEYNNYIISLHDYFFICTRIILLNYNGNLCSDYDKRKCRNCISRTEQIKLVDKILKKVRINRMNIQQSITDERYYKFKMLLENAKLLLPVSNRVEEIYKEAGIKGNYKVVHIGNYSAEEFRPFKIQDNWKKEINIGMIGTLSKHKGADLLFKILGKINREDIKFNFYGRCSGVYEKLFNGTKLNNWGPYKQQDLANILEQIDLGLVIPIWEDNAPQVVMELLNNGKPIIGTKMGGIPDFVNNDNGYLFNPYDEEEINKVIEYINNLDFNEINRLKKNIVRTKTPDEHEKELMEIYQTII